MSDWVPYIINDHKIMLEFTMLDPYYRVPLEKKIGSPTFSTSFKVNFYIKKKYFLIIFYFIFFKGSRYLWCILV